MRIVDYTIIELGDEDDIVIPYQAMHPRYGRAEFTICPVWKRGKIVEAWVYRRQQDLHEAFHFKVFGSTALVFSGRHEAHVWRQFWCQEHKTQSTEFYVPDGTTSLHVSRLSSLVVECR